MIVSIPIRSLGTEWSQRVNEAPFFAPLSQLLKHLGQHDDQVDFLLQ
jgi:hypothetical protein